MQGENEDKDNSITLQETEAPISSSPTPKEKIALKKARQRKFRDRRQRTQSEHASWTRSSFTMRDTDFRNSHTISNITEKMGEANELMDANSGVDWNSISLALHSSNSYEDDIEMMGRNSDGALPTGDMDLLHDSGSFLSVDSSDHDWIEPSAYSRHSHMPFTRTSYYRSRMSDDIPLSRERCITMWRQQGKISDLAHEILEDAKQQGTMNGIASGPTKEDLQLRDPRASVDKQQPIYQDVSDGMISGSVEKVSASEQKVNNKISKGDTKKSTSVEIEASGFSLNPNSDTIKDIKEISQNSGKIVKRVVLDVESSPSGSSAANEEPDEDEDGVGNTNSDADGDVEDNSEILAESRTMYHEAVRWEGVLSKRSEWLRRLEKHYYVLEGRFLRRFASKESYLASREEPMMSHLQDGSTMLADSSGQQNSGNGNTPVPSNNRSPYGNGEDHHGSHSNGVHSNNKQSASQLYILAGVKDSSSRVNGFTFITEDKKTIQVAAPTPVEKIIWMRLALEAIVAIPRLPVAPLDLEEFYAMLVVLYTAHDGKWRTEGDMAVTLPPPSEQVFTRFFRLLDKDVIFCSNYPPSVPFHGSFRGHSGLVAFMQEFSTHTIWTNFKIAGLSVEGSLAVASGKEELENKRDNRKFIQNWIHKFTFYDDGRLARFEINGDVVAASAVFKIPGAATTLKLPQDFNEVDAEHGKSGIILIRVMQGNGVKMGINQKKKVKAPVINVSLQHRGEHGSLVTVKKLKSSSTAVLSMPTMPTMPNMPTLSRRFSSGINLLTSNTHPNGNASHTNSSSLNAHDDTTDFSCDSETPTPFSTGVPRNLGQSSYTAMNPVWNRVLMVPFSHLIGTATLVIDVLDQGKGSSSVPIGHAHVNVAKYIMSCPVEIDNTAHTVEAEEAAMVSDSRWYTVSNTRGEYCGKVLLGITCRRPSSAPQSVQSNKPMKSQSTSPDKLHKDDIPGPPRISKSQSIGTAADGKEKPQSQNLSSNMLHWEATANPQLLHSTSDIKQPKRHHRSVSSRTLHEETMFLGKKSNERRHGWANVKLSPDSRTRTRSAGDASSNDTNFQTSVSNNNLSIECTENKNLHTFMVCGAPFTIPKHYQLIKVCGRGAYGIVIAATNTLTGGNVAIKKVIDCIWHPHQLKQILRESRLIRHMAHENILSLMDLIPPPSYADFRDVYMTIDLMEMDLHRIIYSKEVLLDDHIRYFVFQILSGLNHMHKAGVLHRDLKPSNLLINSDCQLKICDLGLARPKEADEIGMTEYVVTRWYRAPELLLGGAYGEGVDLWAAGCIFAEMLGRKPLFPGETYVHQLQLIMNVLGVPEEHTFKENPSANKLKGRQLLSRTPALAGIDTSTLFPNANPEALDLLWKMLVFDVEKRISVADALRHPYLAMYYDEDAENARPVEKFHSFDLEDLDGSDLKELMFKEICHFHPEEMEKRAKLQRENPDSIEVLPPGWVKRESRSVPGKFYYSNPKRGISTWVKEEMN